MCVVDDPRDDGTALVDDLRPLLERTGADPRCLRYAWLLVNDWKGYEAARLLGLDAAAAREIRRQLRPRSTP